MTDCATAGFGDWEGLAMYEGPGPLPDGPEEKAMTKNPFSRMATKEGDGMGYEAWLARRAAAKPSDDQVYEEYLRHAHGLDASDLSGVVGSGTPGASADLSEGGGGGASDDEVMRLYLDELSGRASERRSLENVRRDEAARREWLVAEAKRRPTSLPRADEDLRPRLGAHGY